MGLVEPGIGNRADAFVQVLGQVEDIVYLGHAPLPAPEPVEGGQALAPTPRRGAFIWCLLCCCQGTAPAGYPLHPSCGYTSALSKSFIFYTRITKVWFDTNQYKPRSFNRGILF